MIEWYLDDRQTLVIRDGDGNELTRVTWYSPEEGTFSGANGWSWEGDYPNAVEKFADDGEKIERVQT